MVTRNNVVIAAITTLSLTVIGALLSDVFSPLSENLRDSVWPIPKANITYAKIFDNKIKAVTQIVKPNQSDVSSTAITFWFNISKENDSKEHYLINTPFLKIPYLRDRQHYFLNFSYFLSIPETFYQFECSLDGQPFEQCMSPKPYGNLQTEAMHIFKVRTKGPLGNTQDSPSTFYFTTITASEVKGIIKNKNQTVQGADVKIDDIPINRTSDSAGHFSFDGIGQGIHNYTIIFKSPVTESCSDDFFIPAAISFWDLGQIFLNEKQCIIFAPSFANNKPIQIEQTINQPSFNRSEINPKLIQVKSNATSTLKNNFLKIEQNSSIIPGNTDLFRTMFWINGSNDIIRNITRVIYYLHPTFTPNVVNSTTRENNFSIIITNWGQFDLRARAFFYNNTVAELKLPINDWNPPK
jgi:YEATS family